MLKNYSDPHLNLLQMYLWMVPIFNKLHRDSVILKELVYKLQKVAFLSG